MNEEAPISERSREFGLFVTRRREELGLTLEKVGLVAGSTKQSISTIEAGNFKTLKADTVIGLSKALKLDLNIIAAVYMTGKLPKEANNHNKKSETSGTEYKKALYTLMKDMPKEDRDEILEMIQKPKKEEK